MTVNVAEAVTDPMLMGLFATFAAGLTQMIKTQFKLSNHLYIQGVSIGAFAIGILLHFLLPDVWQILFDLLAGGTGLTGTVGLVKEIKKAAPEGK